MADKHSYFVAYKDIDNPPLFRSAMLRWIWRTYAQRLTRAGRWFFWPSGIFFGYAMASLQIQGYQPFAYVASLWMLAWVTMLLFRPRVGISVRHADRVCAGASLPVEVEVERRGGSGTDLYVIPHKLPRGVACEQEDGAPLPDLRRGGRARVTVDLVCWKRGVYKLKGYRVESDFPAMLLCASRTFAEPRALVVYPKFTCLARLSLPTGRRYHPGGVALASQLGESLEYIGNREFRDGDNIRDIDWRATARLGDLIVREYREEYFLRVAVILDTFVPRNAAPAAHDSFEHAVSVSASVSDFMARQEYLVDIFAAGPNLYHLTAGRSLAYLDQILDILACVEESRTEPFELLEPEIMEGLAQITTVICVFLDWNEARREFVRKLSSGGASVKVIIVRDGACTLNPMEDADAAGRFAVLSNEQAERGMDEL